MASKGTTLDELGEMLTHVVDQMSTKEDIAAFRAEFKTDIVNLSNQVASIERELKSIRRDLDDLTDKIEQRDRISERDRPRP